MRFLGVRVEYQKAQSIENSIGNKRRKLIATNKNRNRNRHSIMAARSIAKVFDKLNLPYEN